MKSVVPQRLSLFPVHLTATTKLASNSSGGVNAIALKNPSGLPMEILEVRFQLSTERPDLANAPTFVLGGIVECKIDLGKYQITNGFVPVWNFGRSENLRAETTPPTFGIDPVEVISEFVWKLPRPLFIPAGAVLLPTFKHRGLIKQDVEVRISYSGRTLPAQASPKRVHLPYVAPFVAKAFDVMERGSDISKETDLVNPFSEPIHLQRFVGRCYVYAADLDPASENLFPLVSNQMINVRIIDSFGRPIIADYTPFRNAFSGVTRSWEMEHGEVMDPASWYNVYIRKDPPEDGLELNLEDEMLFGQPFISLVGHRTIEIKGGA